MDLTQTCGELLSYALTAPDNLQIMLSTCNSQLLLSVVRPGPDEILQAVSLDLNVPEQAADLPAVLAQLGAIIKHHRQEAA